MVLTESCLRKIYSKQTTLLVCVVHIQIFAVLALVAHAHYIPLVCIITQVMSEVLGACGSAEEGGRPLVPQLAGECFLTVECIT